MGLNDKLLQLKTSLTTFKTNLVDAVAAKGGAASSSSTLSEIVSSINGIQTATPEYDYASLGFSPYMINIINKNHKEEYDCVYDFIQAGFNDKENINFIYFPDYSSNTSDCAYTLSYGKYKYIGNLNYPNAIYANNLFEGNSDLFEIGDVNLPSATDVTRMFSDCSKLKKIGNITFSPDCTNFYQLFQNCNNLSSVTIDTSNATNLSFTFDNCINLKEINGLDCSNAQNMEYCFNCCSFESLPEINTSACTNFMNMLSSCSALKCVSGLNTSNGTCFTSMFNNCGSLKCVSGLNTSNGRIFSYMFENCGELKTVTGLDTSKADYDLASDMYFYMFNYCVNLVHVDTIDMTDYAFPVGNNYDNNIFANYDYKMNYLLIKGLGKFATEENRYSFINIKEWGVNTEDEPNAKQSLIDTLITYSFDRTQLSESPAPCRIQLSENTYNALTDEEKAQITAKGYTVVM